MLIGVRLGLWGDRRQLCQTSTHPRVPLVGIQPNANGSSGFEIDTIFEKALDHLLYVNLTKPDQQTVTNQMDEVVNYLANCGLS